MAKVYYDSDADLGLLEGKTIAVMGYGSQGHAHALNLKESGCDVVVGLYEGSKSWEKAQADGPQGHDLADAASAADVIMILVPDQTQKKLYEESIRPNLKPGNTLMFAHGFNIHYNQIVPPADVDVSMIAPKSPGHIMRDLYVAGEGVPGLLAVHQDASGRAKEMALAYAKGVGCTRAGVLETTFARGDRDRPLRRAGRAVRRRHRADQGGLRDPGRGRLPAGDRLLRVPARAEADRGPDLQGRLQPDALLGERHGGVRRLHGGPKVIDEHVRETMDELLRGTGRHLGRNWILENQAGRPSVQRDATAASASTRSRRSARSCAP